MSGMVYSVSSVEAKAWNTPSTIRHLPLSEANLPLNSVRFGQAANAPSPIEVTLWGIVTLSRLKQA